MSNNITKTIQESLEEFDEKSKDVLIGFKSSGGDEYNEYLDEIDDDALEFIKSHLLQSQIRLLDAVIEETSQRMEANCSEYYNKGYTSALEDQISSLNETLEFIKKNL